MPGTIDGPRAPLSGHHIRGSRGQVFLVLRQPSQPTSAVLVVPPFAEEMNKSRAMINCLSQALAVRGVASVVPDLYGTGDSDGDFSEARWESWQDDIQHTHAWCTSQGIFVSGLLAIRLGAALAVAATTSGRIPGVERTALWQPTFDGARHLTQFLRLRVAALLSSGTDRATVAMLREQAGRGETLEVAGYRLSPDLVADLDAMVPPVGLPTTLGEVRWIELVRNETMAVPEVTQRLIDSTRARGGVVDFTIVSGEPFWASTKVSVNRRIVDLSTNFFAPDEAPSAVGVGP